MQFVSDEPEIGQGNDAGKDVTADLVVGPVANGNHMDDFGGLGITKILLDHITIQGGLDDLFGAPIVVVRYENVLSQSLEMPADAVMVLPEDELPFPVDPFHSEIIEIFGKMHFLTERLDVFFNPLILGPIAFLCGHFGSKMDQQLLEPQELPVEMVTLLRGGSGIVGDHNGSFPAPKGFLSSPGEDSVLFGKVTVFSGFNGLEAVQRNPDEMLGKVGGIAGNEMKPWGFVNKADVFLGVHAFVENQGERAFPESQTVQRGRDLIEELAEDFRIVPVSAVDSVIEGKLGFSVHQKSDADLPKMVFSVLALSPLGQSAGGVSGHVSVIVGGVEEKTVADLPDDFGDPSKEDFSNFFKISFSDSAPVVPVALGTQCGEIHRSDMLDGGLSIPLRKGFLGAGIDQPIEYGIKKIFSNSGTVSPILWGNDGIHNGDQVHLRVNPVSHPEGPEFFDGDFADFLLRSFDQSKEPVGSSQVDLFDHLGFSIHAGNFADVVIGSALFDFFMQVSHTLNLPVGSYTVKAKIKQIEKTRKRVVSAH